MSTSSERARSVFLEAVEGHAPEQWPAFLDRACGGDAALRADVERLLRARVELGSFHEEAGPPAATVDLPPATEAPGTAVGPYKLVEQIGEGGMGSVWMAQQTEPVKRLVAVKLIKPGMDSRQVLARFEAERQALALMDHPNIAKVLDAGTTDAGRPYFVMDLVKGVPITKYCDQHHLTPRQRLELFVPVCQAVQHAHQKGIIHRDLKPSNVLVALYDGRPVPKVIDFGIAKAAGQPLTDKTLVTGFGAIVGTPEYMSPDQAEVNQLDIDTRSDVYSLGVLLYELLAGSPPFSRKELEKAGLLEMLRVIREEEPSKPSTKLSTAEGLPTLAANRGTEPAKLAKLVRGELDWIVMKALEKDRNRRYESANAFAADVQRHLAGEAVQAVPPSAAYRLRKWLRRNRGPALGVVAVTSALLAGAAGSTWQALRATRERDDKQVALDLVGVEKQRALEALEIETAARRSAMATLRSLTDDVVERRLAGTTSLSAEDRAFLKQIVEHYRVVTTVKGESREGREIRAEGYYRVASLLDALGERAESLTAARIARQLFQELADDFPDAVEYQVALVGCHRGLGIHAQQHNRWAEAEGEYRRAVALGEALLARSPGQPEGRYRLAAAQHSLAKLLYAVRRHAEAADAFRAARDHFKRLAGEDRIKALYREGAAAAANDLGLLLKDQGRYPEAREAYEEALAVQQQLADQVPSQAHFRANLAGAHINLGNYLTARGDLDGAVARYDRALTILKRLAAEYPVVPDYRRVLAVCHEALGIVLASRNRHADAEVEHRRGLQIRKTLAADFPDEPQFREQLARGHTNLGALLFQTKKYGESAAEHRLAVGLLAPLAKESPAVADYRQLLVTSHLNLAGALHEQGRAADAELETRRALDLSKRLVTENPDVPKYAATLGAGYGNMGLVARAAGRATEALEWYQKAIDTLAPLVGRDGYPVDARRYLVNSHSRRAEVFADLGRFADAIREYDRLLELDPGPQRLTFAMTRAWCQARVEPDNAVKAVEVLVQSGKCTGGNLYAAACACALACRHTKEVSERERYAARAVGLLSQSAAQGFFNDRAKLEFLGDSDLDPLRERKEFIRLVEELKKKVER